MFRRVNAVVLFVQDFEKSLAFYRDTLGLPVAQLEADFVAFKMDDQDFALLGMSAAAQLVNVEVAEFKSGGADNLLLCADVENVDTAYETLKAKGVVFTKAPVDQPWGIRAAYFRDPDGKIWELRQFLPRES